MSEFIQAKDLRAGQTILWNDVPHVIVDHSFNKTAMRGGIVKCKVKNLFTKSITVEDFSNKKLPKAMVNKVPVVFSYIEGDSIYFLNNETFEEIQVDKNQYKWELNFLEDGIEIFLVMYEGQVIEMALPDSVTLTIAEIIEDNASSEHKKAITKSGLTVFVPKFFKDSTTVSVSTSDGKYKSR